MARALTGGQQIQRFGDVDVDVGAFAGNHFGIGLNLLRVQIDGASGYTRRYGHFSFVAALGRNARGFLDGHLASKLIGSLLAFGARGGYQRTDVCNHLLTQGFIQGVPC